MKTVFSLCLLIAVNLPGMAQTAPPPAEPRDGMLRLKPSDPNKPPERRRPAVAVVPEENKTKHDGSLALASPGVTRRPISPVPANSLEPFPNAAEGIDLVALAINGKAEKGLPDFAVEYLGKRFTFSTLEFRSAFAKEPEKFLPEFGSYCAFHLAKGDAIAGRASARRVVSGRINFFASEAFALSWERDRDALIGSASNVWATARRAEN